MQQRAERKRPYLNLSAADFTLSEDMNVPKAKKLVEEARLAVEEENYELAVKKYDEAIALCPRFNSIKRERNMAQKLLKPSNQLKAGDRKVKTINGVEFAFRRRPPGTCVNSARTYIEEIIPAGV